MEIILTTDSNRIKSLEKKLVEYKYRIVNNIYNNLNSEMKIYVLENLLQQKYIKKEELLNALEKNNKNNYEVINMFNKAWLVIKDYNDTWWENCYGWTWLN